MFKNISGKIKAFAAVFFWLVTIVGVILAFVFGWTEEFSSYGRYCQFHADRFFPLFIGSPIFAWISSLLLYGFGEIIDHTASKK